MHSGVTHEVNALKRIKVCIHAVCEGFSSGQLPFLGLSWNYFMPVMCTVMNCSASASVSRHTIHSWSPLTMRSSIASG